LPVNWGNSGHAQAVEIIRRAMRAESMGPGAWISYEMVEIFLFLRAE
jgi:hypothetical protein